MTPTDNRTAVLVLLPTDWDSRQHTGEEKIWQGRKVKTKKKKKKRKRKEEKEKKNSRKKKLWSAGLVQSSNLLVTIVSFSGP